MEDQGKRIVLFVVIAAAIFIGWQWLFPQPKDVGVRELLVDALVVHDDVQQVVDDAFHPRGTAKLGIGGGRHGAAGAAGDQGQGQEGGCGVMAVHQKAACRER